MWLGATPASVVNWSETPILATIASGAAVFTAITPPCIPTRRPDILLGVHRARIAGGR